MVQIQQEVVNGLIEDALPFIKQGNYALYGFSQGGLLAYMMTIELQKRGLPLPETLFVSGRGPPHVSSPQAA